jgi:predicted MPP superfamily phosphohydrolase
MASFLTADPDKVRTQQMYFLHKIHKTPMSIRPIVSGTSGPTEKLSQFLDFISSKFVKGTESYLRDSSHLVETLPHDVILVTIDVVGLYLNIPTRKECRPL